VRNADGQSGRPNRRLKRLGIVPGHEDDVLNTGRCDVLYQPFYGALSAKIQQRLEVAHPGRKSRSDNHCRNFPCLYHSLSSTLSILRNTPYFSVFHTTPNASRK
jgi:hypothetical protein